MVGRSLVVSVCGTTSACSILFAMSASPLEAEFGTFAKRRSAPTEYHNVCELRLSLDPFHSMSHILILRRSIGD